MGAVGAVTSYLKGDLGGVFSSLSGVGKKIMNTNSGAADRAKQMNTSPAGKSLLYCSSCRMSLRSILMGFFSQTLFPGVVARIFRLLLMLQRLAKRLELW